MRVLLALLLFIFSSLPVLAERITIYRDTWGTPHIYAETERGAAYGQGYAVAEDRLEQVLRSYLEAGGHRAEFFGAQFVDTDFQMRLIRNEAVSKGHYKDQSPEARAIIEAYVDGLNRYMQEHPEKVPAWGFKVEAWHPVALGRYLLWGWWADEAATKLRRRVIDVSPRASNQWAIAPRRTADGGAILMIDPHLPWAGFLGFHEVRMHGGKLHLSGSTLPGAPLIALGHNRTLGWAATTGGPSTTDVYVEELNPQNRRQYKYDGQWRDIRVERVEIRVKTESGVRVEKREIQFTHHGPVLLSETNTAYSLKTPYAEEVGFMDLILRQCEARNLDEFKAAIAMNQWPQQNVMYADVEGNVYYVRAGRVPMRPTGYDWSRPVPGNTSASEWLGIHPSKDLLQVLNPTDGYMQNCNADPMTMMAHPPFKPQDYPPYIYNDTPYRYHPRGERAREVLEANQRMSLPDAMGLAFDTVVDGASSYLAALQIAAENQTDGALLESVRAPLQIVLAWDGRLDTRSTGATLFDAWLSQARRAGITASDLTTLRKHGMLPADKQAVLVTALRTATDELKKTYGSIEVPWGRVHRVGRGNAFFPIAGGDAGGFPTLRAIMFAPPNAKGERIAMGGQSTPTIVVFKKAGVQSWSALPWGESEDPKSAHFTDQAEKLGSRKVLKPTWFERKELMPHVVSTITLDIE